MDPIESSVLRAVQVIFREQDLYNSVFNSVSEATVSRGKCFPCSFLVLDALQRKTMKTGNNC